MIQIDKNGKLNPAALSRDDILTKDIIEQYDYITIKNNFNRIVKTLEANYFAQTMYQEYLKYEVTEDLKFVILEDPLCKEESLDKYGKRKKKWKGI